MLLYILNSKLEIIGIIDNYETVDWEIPFYDAGTFTLEMVTSKDTLELLKEGNYILKNNDLTDLRYIDGISYRQGEDLVERVQASGYSVTKWFNRRITQCQETYKGPAETVIKSYVNNNCVTPSDVNRVIPLLSVQEDQGRGDSIDHTSHFKPLDTEIKDISSAYKLGYRIRFNFPTRDFTFEVYRGTDRSADQSSNSRAIFSSGFENIDSQEYVHSLRDYKNTAIVAGAGEEYNRKIVTVNSSHSGLSRYELFIDARDIQDKVMNGDTEVIVPEAEYNKLLETRGLERLSEYKEVSSFDCTLLDVKTLEYKKDYNVGDIVTIVNHRWRIKMNQQITKVIETYDSNGLTIKVDIGDNVPTIMSKIERKLK